MSWLAETLRQYPEIAGSLPEPIIQYALTRSERHSPSTSYTPEFNAQALRQKAAER